MKFLKFIRYLVGDGGSICFLLDVWCSKVPLKIVILDFSPV